MKVSLGTILSEVKKRSIRKRRMVSLITALSLLISSGVVWELRSIGITMVNDVGCGIEEHIHDESCYSQGLICEAEESADSDETVHIHDAGCYEEYLSCEQEEHTHTAECYDDEEEYYLLNRLFDDEAEDIPVFEINQDYSEGEYSDDFEDYDNPCRYVL